MNIILNNNKAYHNDKIQKKEEKKDTRIIIIQMPMFIVLSSWQNHCESSPGSFDKM